MLQEEHYEDINDIVWQVGNMFDETWDIQEKNLIKYNGNEKNVIIPKGTEKITYCAFFGKNLDSILFPDSITTIELGAFENNNLKELELLQNLAYIGIRSFADNNITSLIINSDLVIEEEAFLGNPLEIVRIKNAKKIDWRSGIPIESVKVLEIASYKEHIAFCNLCPNIEELYIDNVPEISLYRFLKGCKLNQKKNLRKIFIKNEISSLEKKALKIIWPNLIFNNVCISKISETTIVNDIANTNQNKDYEIQERMDKIYQTINLLNENEKKAIEKYLYLLIEQYKMDLEELKPKFEIENEIIMSFEQMDISTLRKTLLSNLDTIIVNLAVSKNLNQLLKEIAEYKSCMFTEIESAPIEIATTIDKVRFIVFVYQKLKNENIQNQLNEILDYFQKRISEEIMCIFENEISLALELDIITEFERKITALYQNVQNYQYIIETYQELWNSLEQKNNSELSKDIRTSMQIINIFYISDQNKFNDKLQKIITNYKNRINEIISNKNIEGFENIKEASEIELELREDLQPLLVEIYNLSPKAVCFNKLKEELNDSLKCFEKEENVKLLKGAIIDIIQEIKNILENEYINAEMKIEIQDFTKSCLQKWLEELTKNEYKILETIPVKATEIISDNIRFEILILKELLTIKINLENYIKKSIEYKKISNGILDMDKDFSFENLFIENDLSLVNKQGFPIEEFNLDNYKNYMINKYSPRLDDTITHEQWKMKVEEIRDECLNKIIKDTKKFILMLLKGEKNKEVSGTYMRIKVPNNGHYMLISNEIKMHTGLDICVSTTLNGYNLVVSKYLLGIFFEKFLIEEEGMEINMGKLSISGPKEVFDILYENNCSNQIIRRRMKELADVKSLHL